jgi:hypothetical protein
VVNGNRRVPATPDELERRQKRLSKDVGLSSIIMLPFAYVLAVYVSLRYQMFHDRTTCTIGVICAFQDFTQRAVSDFSATFIGLLGNLTRPPKSAVAAQRLGYGAAVVLSYLAVGCGILSSIQITLTIPLINGRNYEEIMDGLNYREKLKKPKFFGFIGNRAFTMVFFSIFGPIISIGSIIVLYIGYTSPEIGGNLNSGRIGKWVSVAPFWMPVTLHLFYFVIHYLFISIILVPIFPS